MLVSVARYQEITGDTSTATATVETALIDSQALLEEQLGRPLETAERTERARIFTEPRGNVFYPAATPVTAVSDPAGAEIVGHAVVGGALGESPPYFLTDPDTFATVTYTGGYDPAAALGDADYLPVELQRAIAWAARAIADPSGFAPVPSGAKSVRVGDVSVTFGPGGAAARGEVDFSRRLVRRWRRRRELVT